MLPTRGSCTSAAWGARRGIARAERVRGARRRGGARVRRRRRRRPRLNALVAPDSFKGTFSASEVAAAVARGLRAGGREAVELPIADGGEGTMDALGGTVYTAAVSDPLGRPVEARFS